MEQRYLTDNSVHDSFFVVLQFMVHIIYVDGHCFYIEDDVEEGNTYHIMQLVVLVVVGKFVEVVMMNGYI